MKFIKKIFTKKCAEKTKPTYSMKVLKDKGLAVFMKDNKICTMMEIETFINNFDVDRASSDEEYIKKIIENPNQVKKENSISPKDLPILKLDTINKRCNSYCKKKNISMKDNNKKLLSFINKESRNLKIPPDFAQLNLKQQIKVIDGETLDLALILGKLIEKELDFQWSLIDNIDKGINQGIQGNFYLGPIMINKDKQTAPLNIIINSYFKKREISFSNF